MHIIKLNAIDSTNTFLRQLSSAEIIEDFTVVVTEQQTNGRGQMGTHWETEAGKNLMFSMFKEAGFVKIGNQFTISMLVSTAIINALSEFEIPKLYVKWPNDILAENKKICGILIENVIQNNKLSSSIIGIGLNVNQLYFKKIPNASSLKKITGIHYNVDEVLQAILKHLKLQFDSFSKNSSELKHIYESNLFRKDKPSTFKDSGENVFTAFIKGVSKEGNLILLLEDNVFKEFDLKEIQLLY